MNPSDDGRLTFLYPMIRQGTQVPKETKIMDSKSLNARKDELLSQQEKVLNSAQEARVKLTPAQEEQFTKDTAEINNIGQTLVRMAAIAKGKSEVGRPQAEAVIPVNTESLDPKKLTPAYNKAFWSALKNRTFNPTNAALGEGGTAGDGSYLVPISTDPTIPALANVECTVVRCPWSPRPKWTSNFQHRP
jgi:hypothetical protein